MLDGRGHAQHRLRDARSAKACERSLLAAPLPATSARPERTGARDAVWLLTPEPEETSVRSGGASGGPAAERPPTTEGTVFLLPYFKCQTFTLQ